MEWFIVCKSFNVVVIRIFILCRLNYTRDWEGNKLRTCQSRFALCSNYLHFCASSFEIEISFITFLPVPNLFEIGSVVFKILYKMPIPLVVVKDHTYCACTDTLFNFIVL